MEERRRHARYPTSVPGRCRLEGGAEFPIETVNISAVALLARSTQPFYSPRKAWFRLELREGTFECEAVCVRVSQSAPWEGAFLFTDVAPESAERLEAFLERLRASAAS